MDVSNESKTSYLFGADFLTGFNNCYSEKFEDNYRYFLEDCDFLDVVHVNVDFNSFWGGLR